MKKIIEAIKENKLIITAALLMIISVIMACQSYSYHKDGFVVPFVNLEIGGSNTVETLMPNMISTMVAIALYSGVVIRNSYEIFKEPLKVILCVANILFLSSLTTIFIVADFKLPFLDLSGYAILILAIALSWIGMKAISGYAWVILLISSLGQITRINVAMGFAGVVYILCAFVSMGMQIASGYLVVSKDAFKSEFYNMGQVIKGDINKSIEATKEIASSAAKVATTAATGIPQA